MATANETKTRIHNLVIENGWTDLTVFTNIIDFIEERNLLEELADTFEDIAEEGRNA